MEVTKGVALADKVSVTSTQNGRRRIMRTLGVDLAAEPVTTAVAVIEWRPGTARVSAVRMPADDSTVLDLMDGADKVGIDCPLGWPDAFVQFVTAHHHDALALPDDLTSVEWRRSLSSRHTDEHVRATLSMRPLSVSSDRIGVTAMRAARLQALLADRGHPVDRAGTGRVVEVYPAAGLRCWGLPDRGYKGPRNQGQRESLVDQLHEGAPWLEFGEAELRCRQHDHVLDAVVSALLARAAAMGHSAPPPNQHQAAARREGWIALPTCRLDQLVSPT
jgi:predicted nuclease with RNAse H fold